ncbi:MAG: HEAT repeat domain-containing protein [Nitrospinota bacterium]
MADIKNVLMNAIEDSNGNVRKSAALALGNLKAKEGAQALINLMKDKHW